MADKSRIAWCDATINPCYGCSPVSPACDHCYAARMAPRLGKLTEGTHKYGKWTGKINLFPERMKQALRWRKPRRIFVGSMTDLFHKSIPDEFLAPRRHRSGSVCGHPTGEQRLRQTRAAFSQVWTVRMPSVSGRAQAQTPGGCQRLAVRPRKGV